jgi:transcriptional regulator with XRE-family HTH domain
MTVFERIKELAKKRSKTIKQVTQDLNYSENYFYSLKSGKQPSAEKLKEIAEYFNVSVDYLLGRTDDLIGGQESDDLDEMLDRMMSFDGQPMTDADREAIRAYLQGRLSKK